MSPTNTFLRACNRERTDHTPIWLMRQAGRYQPEYRAIRARTSFIDLCRTPDLAAEVTLLPVQQLDVDAAILFADILLVLEPLGISFEFTRDDGPSIRAPIRTREAIDRVADHIDAGSSLAYVMETIRRTRAALARREKQVPLIGFAGAPFTLASYVIEGGGSRSYAHTKRLMYADAGAWNALMAKLTAAVSSYLGAQIDAGAQAVQVFDSWVGCLGPRDYGRYVQPHVARLFAGLRASQPGTPCIHFGTGNPELYPLMKEAGGDVIGIDWRADLGTTWRALGDVALQGNLDPAALLAPLDTMRDHAREVLDRAEGRPGHVFNLGHGVYPETSVAQVRALVDFVHEASSR